jgi:phasin family protein
MQKNVATQQRNLYIALQQINLFPIFQLRGDVMTDYTQNMDKFFAQTENWMKPVINANKVTVSNFEKFVDFQMKAWQKDVYLGMNQLKAAAEVDSPKAFQSYLNKQVEVAGAVRQQMLNDFKALTEMSTHFKDDFTKLTENNVQEIKEAVSKASSKAA